LNYPQLRLPPNNEALLRLIGVAQKLFEEQQHLLKEGNTFETFP